MSLKTLDSSVKVAFENAGISLSAEKEHVASVLAGAVNWPQLITDLGNAASTVIPIVLSVLSDFGVTL